MKNFILFIFLLASLINKSDAQVQPAHVVICILENHAYNQIHGNAAAPYINSLLSDPNTALLQNSYALAHPSQANYLMLFSGNNQGVTNDNVPTNIPFTTPNLGHELISAGFSFAGYSETQPYAGYTGATSGLYARKHNPWVNWQGIGTNGISSSFNLPLTSFPTNFNSLPTVSFVIPNLVSDMHNGTGNTPIATGDAWIQTNLDPYIQWCKTNNSLFILTFDEDDNSVVNQIFTTFTGQDIKSGNYTQKITHYNVLRTIEDLYQLPYAGHSADSSFITDIWRTLLPIKLSSFNVYKKGTKNMLDWTTAIERSAFSFTIQKSNNGKDFTNIDILSATGNNTHYSYIDNEPLKSINYYRIKMINEDGKFYYSPIKSIDNNSPLSINVYPNPASNNLTVKLSVDLDAPILVSIKTIDGILVMQKSITLSNVNKNTTNFNISALAKGSYLIIASIGNEEVVMKFEKE